MALVLEEMLFKENDDDAKLQMHENLHKNVNENIFQRLAKALIRLRICPG